EDLQVRPWYDRAHERPAQGARARHIEGALALQPLPAADRLRPDPARGDRAGAANVLQGVRAIRGADRNTDLLTRSTDAKERPNPRARPPGRGCRASPAISRGDGRRFQYRRCSWRAV